MAIVGLLASTRRRAVGRSMGKIGTSAASAVGATRAGGLGSSAGARPILNQTLSQRAAERGIPRGFVATCASLRAELRAKGAENAETVALGVLCALCAKSAYGLPQSDNVACTICPSAISP